MNSLLIKARRTLFGVSLDEVTLARRGFHATSESQRIRLERIGGTFLAGYHAALEESSLSRLETLLNAIELEYRGFAFEGAGMALALLDLVTPWKGSRVDALLRGPGDAHIYMVHVGVGWAFARAPFGTMTAFRRLDPILRWLALDGYGFHEGYFHWSPETPNRRPRFDGYRARAFDQGLGRSLWFVAGSDVGRIAGLVSQFDATRHADLWSGAGLACAYAGSLDRETIETLRVLAGRFAPNLAQGAAFAAKARQRAGNPAQHTELACQVLCGVSAPTAAGITDLAFERLPANGEGTGFETWRQRIAASFAQEILA
ncbi:MAG TPA: DUF1702 family protein [Blastocatellia bacterium]|nr:DUF1702 family protein [Blastocatellia bacterium]